MLSVTQLLRRPRRPGTQQLLTQLSRLYLEVLREEEALARLSALNG